MKHYSTSDLALAAALKVKGMPVTHIEQEYGDVNYYFCFEDTVKLHELINQFYNDELVAPCSLYNASVRSLMSMVKSARKQNRYEP